MTSPEERIAGAMIADSVAHVMAAVLDEKWAAACSWTKVLLGFLPYAPVQP